MDFYTNLTCKVQKCRGLGSRDPISKFCDAVITFERLSYPLRIWCRQRMNLSCVWTIKRPL